MPFSRIGEAANPGPKSANTTLLIGCFNPTGLAGTEELLSQLPREGATIWGVSETHLTQPGAQKFDRAMKCQKCPLRTIHGSPVPPRSCTATAIGGKQTGVSFLSNVPCRNMTPTWPKEEWAKSRFHVACFQVGERTVQGGVVYGHAHHTESIPTKLLTEQTCHWVTDRLLTHSTGLRFITGDFNQKAGDLECMRTWTNKGWVNVQEWAEQKLGRPIAPTCKGVTTVDHLYVSPELAMYLRDVRVFEDFFPEHAVLHAIFDLESNMPRIPKWRMPRPIDWDSIGTLQESDEPFHTTAADSTTRLQQIFQELESRVREKAQQVGAPCPSQTFGRCQTEEVQWVRSFEQPPKKGRRGEYQPEFHGVNRQHSQWVRQLRRMESYHRLAKVLNPNAKQLEHKVCLWQSISQAAGFHPDFPRWWQAQTGQLWGSDPPSFDEAGKIQQAMHTLVTKQAQALTKQRVQHARETRQQDPAKIFQDLRQPPAQPVQMLLHSCVAAVTEVDLHEHAIEVSPPQNWKPGETIQVGHQHVVPIHVEQDKLWLTAEVDVSNLSSATIVRQEEYIGNVTHLFHAFGEEWRKRWDRHINTDDDFWQPILDFVHDQMPQPQPMHYEPIQTDLWRQTIRRKPKKAATGPDGVSRRDLLQCPADLTGELLRLVTDVEAGAAWPSPPLTGFVVALEKVAGASVVGQFRPITVFSMLFRTWGSVRAREVLQHLAQLSPTTCTGNLPGRTSSQIWYGILEAIELGHATQTGLSGCVIDLVKAFNLLPRVFILQVMRHLQVAPQVLSAWGRALAWMSRRFKILGQTGPPIRSVTGFAEGDALSVTAMLSLNLVLHTWMARRHASLTIWSYVDNIELTGPTGQSLVDGYQGLLQFSSLVDVAIDTDKTYLWSTDPQDRHEIRLCELTERRWARDLGGHLSYNKVPTNQTVVQKCQAMAPLWSRLARSLAPYSRKVQALKQKAWASCLYAVQSVHLADNHFKTLRFGAMQGLQEYSPGTSPIAHLSLVEHPSTDPQYHALQATVMMFRDMHPQGDVAGLILKHLQEDVSCANRPGPVSVLLGRLQQLAWQWKYSTVFADHLGQHIDVLHCPIQELKARLTQGWQNKVQHQLMHRDTFQGIQHVNAALTVEALHEYPAPDQAILRKCLNGTFFTAEHLVHRNPEETGLCKACGAPDSQKHRHWECEAYAQCRTVPPAQIPSLLEIAPCLSNHGWIPEPPSLQRFRNMCMSLPDEHTCFVWPAAPVDELLCFTDGGCSHPTCPFSRLSTWGVVCADEHSGFWPLASGVVPGWVQTSLRAELVAAISACSIALQTQRFLTLWVDNDLVFRRIHKLQKGTWQPKPNVKDSDLWKQLGQYLGRLGTWFKGCHKVCSHQDPSTAQDEYEAWVFAGNQAADRLVNTVLHTRPQLVQAQAELQQDLRHLRLVRKQVHGTMLQVGKHAIQLQNPQPKTDTLPARMKYADLAETVMPRLDLQRIPPKYHFPGSQRVVAWLNDLTNLHCPLVLVSWYQLHALFQHCTGLRGLTYTRANKQWGSMTTAGGKDFVQRCSLVTKYIEAMIHVHNGCYVVHHVRPQSAAVDFWAMCLHIRIKPEHVQLADEILQRQQRRFRSVKQLRDVP
eukprot:Skav215027  [mRNA]  locus=scaffold966:514741:519573:- [translate_table: standard]